MATKIRGNTQIMPGTITEAEVNLTSKIVVADSATTGNIDLGNTFKVINSPNPTLASDVATKNYVDGLVTGISWKQSVKVSTQADINLASPGATIDGIAMVAGDRVLVRQQTTAADNGIYVWNGATSAMTRAADADTAAELTGIGVFVEQGTNADTGWTQTADNITLGTDPITFVQFSGAGTFTAGLGIDITSNVISTKVNASGAITNTAGVGSDELAIILDGVNQDLIVNGSDQLVINFSTLYNDQRAVAAVDLASQTNGKGASIIGIEDAASLYTATNVEAALAEVKQLVASGQVVREAPSGSINSTNRQFVLASSAVANSETVMVNGLVQGDSSITETLGSGSISISGATVTGTATFFTMEFAIGDVLSTPNGLGIVNAITNDTDMTLDQAWSFNSGNESAPVYNKVTINGDYAARGFDIVFASGNQPTTGDQLRVTYTAK